MLATLALVFEYLHNVRYTTTPKAFVHSPYNLSIIIAFITQIMLTKLVEFEY